MISVWLDIKTASSRSNNILSNLKFIKNYKTKFFAPTLAQKWANQRLNRRIMHFSCLRRRKRVTKNLCNFVRRPGHLLKAALTHKWLDYGGNNRLANAAYKSFRLLEDPLYQCRRDPKYQKQWKKKPPGKSWAFVMIYGILQLFTPQRW